MPRGSKPGERRGDRQCATPNKRTVLTQRILAAASEHPSAALHEVFAILVKYQALPADISIAVARKSLPARASRSTKAIAARTDAQPSTAGLVTLDVLQRNSYRDRSEFSGKAEIGQALEQTVC